jgi:hypothetical protein
MSIGADGAMIVADVRNEQQPPVANTVTHVIKVRVDDVSAQVERARAAGARVLEPPTDREYGERECTVETLPVIAGSSAKHCVMSAPKTLGARPSPRGRSIRALNFPHRPHHTLRRRARGEGRDSSQDRNAVNAP